MDRETILIVNQVELDQTVIDSAKSSMVYGVTKGISTPGRAVSKIWTNFWDSRLKCPFWTQATVSFINQALKGVPKDYGVELLKKYQDITKEDIIRTLKKYFLPLFDPSSSVAIVVTAPSKADEIATKLGAFGFEVTQRELAVDPEELEDGSGVDGDTDSVSNESRWKHQKWEW